MHYIFLRGGGGTYRGRLTLQEFGGGHYPGACLFAGPPSTIQASLKGSKIATKSAFALERSQSSPVDL